MGTANYFVQTDALVPMRPPRRPQRSNRDAWQPQGALALPALAASAELSQ